MTENKLLESRSVAFIAPSLQMGGIERVMSVFANYFVSQSITVHYITLFPFEPFFELDQRVICHLSPYSFPRTGRSVIQTISYYYKMLSPVNGYIKKVIKNERPDVIVCFGDWFPHLVMLQLKGLQIPLFYGNRSNPKIKYSIAQELIRTLAYKFAPPQGVVAQTSEAYLRKRKILGHSIPIAIIPNPVREIADREVVKENWIVSVGRLHLEKGFVRLIECFSKVESSNDWKLVLAGTGVHEDEIKQKAKAYNISDKVIFTGKVADVDTLLLKSKIFVLSSHKEGYPNALCEAMSAGLACIAFDIVAGPKDIIKDGVNGILVPDNDLKTMADKIQLLINDNQYRESLGKIAKEIAVSNSIEKIGDQFIKFLEENR